MSDDLYYNSGKAIFLRISGIHYQRVSGKGWKIISAEHLPGDAAWDKLHELQRLAYVPVLKAEGLIKES